MYKTVFIEIFDLRPVLKFFKPLLASPGYNSRSKGNCRQRLRKILERGRGEGGKQGVSTTMANEQFHESGSVSEHTCS